MHVLVQFKAEEFDEWKAVFDDRESVRAEHGWRGGRVFTRHDSDRRVVLLAEWDSAENAEAYFDSSGFREAMTGAGVENKPEVTLLDSVENIDPATEDPTGETTEEDV